MTQPHFEVPYETGPIAPFVDWVAGGNFDGYVVKYTLTFHEASNTVTHRKVVVDQSRYDGSVSDAKSTGTFEYSDKNTITVHLSTVTLRGRILREDRSMIVFSYFEPASMRGMNEVFQLAPNIIE